MSHCAPVSAAGRSGRAGGIARILLLAPLAFGAAAALADDEARRWLADMNEALASRNYQGEFLHLHLPNGRVEKLRILHRVKDGHVSERLLSLTGNGREFVRRDSQVQCFLPDQRTVLVEDGGEQGPLLGTLPHFDAALESSYRVEMGGREPSLLGGMARIVAIDPRDGYRYGYRLWIAEDTHMPVRTDLCDARGNVLETVLFTRLSVGGAIPDPAFRPAAQTEGYTWVRHGPAATRAAAVADVPWRLLQLPPGFQLSSAGEQRLPGSEQPAVHFVLSDGLASVSVFIEATGSAPAAEGRGQLGLASVFSRLVGGHQVTAVGEVPPATVQYIAAGVEAATPPPPGGVGVVSAAGVSAARTAGGAPRVP